MQTTALSGWTREQKHVVAATFLGWALDAFDYFLLVFVLKDISQEFHTEITNVTIAILLTLAMRPVGAFIFGRAADHWGRRPTLMVNVLLYSALEFATAFSPNLVNRRARTRQGSRRRQSIIAPGLGKQGPAHRARPARNSKSCSKMP